MLTDAYVIELSISHGLKLGHHIHIRFAIRVELGVYLNLVLLFIDISVGVFIFHLNVTLDLYLRISYYFKVAAFTSAVSSGASYRMRANLYSQSNTPVLMKYNGIS